MVQGDIGDPRHRDQESPTMHLHPDMAMLSVIRALQRLPIGPHCGDLMSLP